METLHKNLDVQLFVKNLKPTVSQLNLSGHTFLSVLHHFLHVILTPPEPMGNTQTKIFTISELEERIQKEKD